MSLFELLLAVGTPLLDQRSSSTRLGAMRGTQIATFNPAAAEVPFHRRDHDRAIGHRGRRGNCHFGRVSPFTGGVIQKYRQQKADADQHSAYYHTSLHDCPPLGTKQTVTPISAGSATRE